MYETRDRGLYGDATGGGNVTYVLFETSANERSQHFTLLHPVDNDQPTLISEDIDLETAEVSSDVCEHVENKKQLTEEAFDRMLRLEFEPNDLFQRTCVCTHEQRLRSR